MFRIFPLEQIISKNRSKDDYLRKIDGNGVKTLSEIIGSDYAVCGSGKDAIRTVMGYLRLSQKDEVYITTTTGSTFVSTCVSATIFNFCKISRVITDATKVIFVIHNFGFPHPDLAKYRDLADKMGITLIEDSAFAFDSFTRDGVRTGSVGDYAIYSLPKIFPIEYGGILSGKTIPKIGGDDYIINELNKWVPRLWYIKAKRLENYKHLNNLLSEHSIYHQVNNENPFMFGFYNKYFGSIYQLNNQNWELGRTHVENEVHLPVNSFIERSDYIEFIIAIKKYI